MFLQLLLTRRSSHSWTLVGGVACVPNDCFSPPPPPPPLPPPTDSHSFSALNVPIVDTKLQVLAVYTA